MLQIAASAGHCTLKDSTSWPVKLHHLQGMGYVLSPSKGRHTKHHYTHGFQQMSSGSENTSLCLDLSTISIFKLAMLLWSLISNTASQKLQLPCHSHPPPVSQGTSALLYSSRLEETRLHTYFRCA